MLIWLTIFNSVAAVRAGPVAPSGASPSGDKYCYCIDGQGNDVNTATNTVYQGYIQVGSFDKNVVQLNYVNGAATATVSYSTFSVHLY
jgi:hypothetical protein